jgi:hypothetical protein
MCWIEHVFIRLHGIMPHASEDQKGIGQKALANVRKEMARPRVVESAQKTVGNAATNGIARRD